MASLAFILCPGCELLKVLLSLAAFSVVIGAPVGIVLWIAYYLLSLPLRRQERARCFVELVAAALHRGRPVETALVEISSGGDPLLGRSLRRLSTELSRGSRLGQALDKVPRLVPAPVRAMLHAGESIGDLRKVLPACNSILQDAQSHVRGAASYLVGMAFVFSPFAVFSLTTVMIIVIPKFNEVLIGIGGSAPPMFVFFRENAGRLIAVEAVFCAVLLLAGIVYTGGPRLRNWLRRVPGWDWFAWQMPWKRNRMLRDFSSLLSILLDQSVPEAEAVDWAGRVADNSAFSRRLALTRARLARGERLVDALRPIGAGNEFAWRLENAAQGPAGFRSALAGWHESLDARAFQQEQAAAHLITSALVVVNGAIVAIVAVGVFGALVSIIETGVLW
ncbi:MAG: type II secretion system F family protein [Verrucomicrobiota bacterium]